MELLMLAMLAGHTLVVGLAIWGSFSKRASIHVPAILALMMDLGGLMIAQGIRLDGMFPATFGWILLGPVFLPISFAEAVAEAPLWVLPLSALGVATGIVGWIWLWKRAKWRVWTFAAVLAGTGVAWVTAEISVEIAMRTAAQSVGAYCNYGRLPAPSMFTAGLSEQRAGVPSHGVLASQTDMYVWSFKQTRWVRSSPCKDGRCWCYSGSHGLPNLPRKFDSWTSDS